MLFEEAEADRIQELLALVFGFRVLSLVVAGHAVLFHQFARWVGLVAFALKPLVIAALVILLELGSVHASDAASGHVGYGVAFEEGTVLLLVCGTVGTYRRSNAVRLDRRLERFGPDREHVAVAGAHLARGEVFLVNLSVGQSVVPDC